MKNCAYCGRENDDDRTHCLECGSEFVAERIEAPLRQPRDYIWIKAACGRIGVAFVIVLGYLLSLGPVMRYCATVSPQISTTNGTTITTRRTVTYPRWVGVVYYPAFSLTSGGGYGEFAHLYLRYLQWWEESQPQKDGVP